MENINGASLALILPEDNYGLGAAYISIFKKAGWSARVLEGLREYDGADTLLIISFEEAARHPERIKRNRDGLPRQSRPEPFSP